MILTHFVLGEFVGGASSVVDPADSADVGTTFPLALGLGLPAENPGALAATEGADTAALTAELVNDHPFTGTQPTGAGYGGMRYGSFSRAASVAMGATEQADVFAGTLSVAPLTADLAATEGADTVTSTVMSGMGSPHPFSGTHLTPMGFGGLGYGSLAKIPTSLQRTAPFTRGMRRRWVGAYEPVITYSFATLGATEAPDVAELTVELGTDVTAAALATTEGPDVAAITGQSLSSGELGATEAADTFAGTARNAQLAQSIAGATIFPLSIAWADGVSTSPGILADLTATEQGDVAAGTIGASLPDAFSGYTVFPLVLSQQTGLSTPTYTIRLLPGIFTLSGAPALSDFEASLIPGRFDLYGQSVELRGPGSADQAANLVATEGPDVFVGTAEFRPSVVNLAATEAPDVFAGTGQSTISVGSLLASEQPDTFAGTAQIPQRIDLGATEGADVVVMRLDHGQSGGIGGRGGRPLQKGKPFPLADQDALAEKIAREDATPAEPKRYFLGEDLDVPKVEIPPDEAPAPVVAAAPRTLPMRPMPPESPVPPEVLGAALALMELLEEEGATPLPMEVLQATLDAFAELEDEVTT